jgi:2-desacetyl-2-hydroxyethyl bacteriochlorophyllide A dehydrogenase
MRAGIYRDVRRVEVEQAPRPQAGPAGAVIAVAACGICGSDLHSYTHGAWVEKGMTLGHEFAGEVVEVGPEAEGIVAGDRVAVMPLVPCGTCWHCEAGRTNLCEAPDGAAGGFADFTAISRAVRGASLFPMPPDLLDEEGAWLEPLAVSVRAVELAAADPREPVVVLGLGAIGQGAVQVLRDRGHRRVIAVDVSPLRLEAAAAGGAHHVIDASQGDLRAVIEELTGTTCSPYQPRSGRAGTVLECSGATSALETALDIVRPGGTVLLVALAGHRVEVDLDKAVQKELRVQGSFAYRAADTSEAFELIVTRRVDVRPLITQQVPLDELTAAFEQQLDKDRSIKVMVRPGAGEPVGLAADSATN